MSKLKKQIDIHKQLKPILDKISEIRSKRNLVIELGDEDGVPLFKVYEAGKPHDVYGVLKTKDYVIRYTDKELADKLVSDLKKAGII